MKHEVIRRTVLAATLCLAVGATLIPTPASAQVCEPLNDGRLADAFYEGTVIYWDPVVEFRSMTLTISGPCEDIVKEFGPKDQIMFDIREIERVTDGQYTWTLRREASIDKGVQESLREARFSGEEEDLWWSYFQAGKIPAGPYTDSGFFSVDRGQIIDPNSGSEEKSAVASKAGARSSGLGEAAVAGGFATGGGEGGNVLSEKVVLTNADGVIRNSLCVGFDCPNSPAFGDSTIILQENNTRIKFSDTSVSSFPSGDWEIEANSNLNGGQSYLAFNDCGSNDLDGSCANDPVFGVEAGARQNALWVESSGEVGIGTANPVLELHAVSGDSPGLRLEQDTSSGFGAQTWDIVGNETSFFIRDATNGSTLPFRIRPGSASNALVIDADSQVGVGILSPTERLHVFESANVNTLAVVENTNTGLAAAGVLRAKSDAATVNFQAHGSGRTLMRFGETVAGWSEMLQVTGNGLMIGTVGNTPLILGTSSNNVLEITSGGDVLYQGVAVHSDYVFEPDYALPSIEEQEEFMWSNKHLPAIGPARYSEDGREIMALGSDRQAIVEELEKAHIYIAQLNRELQDKSSEVEGLEQKLDTKSAEVDDLAERLDRLEAALADD